MWLLLGKGRSWCAVTRWHWSGGRGILQGKFFCWYAIGNQSEQYNVNYLYFRWCSVADMHHCCGEVIHSKLCFLQQHVYVLGKVWTWYWWNRTNVIKRITRKFSKIAESLTETHEILTFILTSYHCYEICQGIKHITSSDCVLSLKVL